MNTPKKRLAVRIRFARELAGLSQQKCADALGLLRSAYTQIELGHRNITALELQSLAELLGVKITDMLVSQPLEEAKP